MNGHNLTTFWIHIIIDKIKIGIVKRHFCKFEKEVRPLIDVKIGILLNIMRMNGQNLTTFWIHSFIDKISVGIVKCHFSQICKTVIALDWCNLGFCSIS